MAAGAQLLLLTSAQAAWRLEHEEDFSTARALDSRFWRLETGFQRNRESQYYASGNVAVRDGMLSIEARRETLANAAFQAGSSDWRRQARAAAYTSGSLVFQRPLRYARVTVVARIPGGAGVWPAIWLLGDGSQGYGEIDIMEYVGKHPGTVFATVHFGRQAHGRAQKSAHLRLDGLEGSWRTYTLEWTPARIAIDVDGQPLLGMDPDEARSGANDPLRQPMFLRMNLALGGSWSGWIDDRALPARFDIASIRIWTWQGDGDGAAMPGVATPEEPLMRWGR